MTTGAIVGLIGLGLLFIIVGLSLLAGPPGSGCAGCNSQ